MIAVDKWFRINRADKGLCNYWPELSAGVLSLKFVNLQKNAKMI